MHSSLFYSFVKFVAKVNKMSNHWTRANGILPLQKVFVANLTKKVFVANQLINFNHFCYVARPLQIIFGRCNSVVNKICMEHLCIGHDPLEIRCK